MKLQNKTIKGIDGNWDHILTAHGVTENEVVSVFKSSRLRPKRIKKKGSANYMVIGRAYSGRTLRICYSWYQSKKNWIYVHTAF